jgi:hypothetical protein
MRFTCVGCGAEFEAEEGRGIRCPKCLRQHGLVPESPIEEPTAVDPEPRRRVPRLALVLVACVAVVAAVAGFLIARRRPVAPPPGALTETQLRQAMRGRGLPEGMLAAPFAIDEGVRGLARTHATGGAALARAESIARAVEQLLGEKKATRWRLLRLPEQSPRTAAELLSALLGGSVGEVHSYEAAVLTLAAARAAGLNVLLAEVRRQGGRSADPSGFVGAYAVAVYEGPARAAQKPQGFVQSFGGGAVEDAAPLDDLAAVAGFYVLRSLAHSGGDGDTAAAYRDADLALKLWPDSPLALAARGQALLAGGGARDALVDLRRAANLRGDAPRLHNLASALLGAREPEQAEASLRSAVAQDPGFAPAHLALSVLAAARHDEPGARAELDAAERADQQVPGLRLVRAQLSALKGDLSAAEKEIRAEMAADPGDERATLMLYGILKAQSRDADAQTLREELIARSRHPDRLRQVFDAAEGKGS